MVNYVIPSHPVSSLCPHDKCEFICFVIRLFIWSWVTVLPLPFFSTMFISQLLTWSVSCMLRCRTLAFFVERFWIISIPFFVFVCNSWWKDLPLKLSEIIWCEDEYSGFVRAFLLHESITLLLMHKVYESAEIELKCKKLQVVELKQ